jgi:hypothetical protein
LLPPVPTELATSAQVGKDDDSTCLNERYKASEVNRQEGDVPASIAVKQRRARLTHVQILPVQDPHTYRGAVRAPALEALAREVLELEPGPAYPAQLALLQVIDEMVVVAFFFHGHPLRCRCATVIAKIGSWFRHLPYACGARRVRYFCARVQDAPKEARGDSE